MDISIVIPSYNTEDTIGATIAALQAQETSLELEIVLVDCSEHDRVEKIAAEFSKVQFVKREKRFNPGEGRNIGAEQAKGKLLVFVDSDVTLEKDALDNAWQYFQAGHQIFGGALELKEGAEATPASYLEHYFFNHESQKLRPGCERSNLSSALMLFERDVFLKEGGFKDIPRMQDTELTERLRANGYKLSFTPTVSGEQVQDSPMKKVLRKIFINGKNLYFIRYKKDMSSFKKLIFLLLLPLLSGLKITRIFFRHMRYQNFRKRIITILLIPLFIAASLVWMWGFYNAILFDEGISAER